MKMTDKNLASIMELIPRNSWHNQMKFNITMDVALE